MVNLCGTLWQVAYDVLGVPREFGFTTTDYPGKSSRRPTTPALKKFKVFNPHT